MNWLGDTSLGFDCWGDIVLWRKGTTHHFSRDEYGSTAFECFRDSDHGGNVFLMNDSARVVDCLEK